MRKKLDTNGQDESKVLTHTYVFRSGRLQFGQHNFDTVIKIEKENFGRGYRFVQ